MIDEIQNGWKEVVVACLHLPGRNEECKGKCVRIHVVVGEI